MIINIQSIQEFSEFLIENFEQYDYRYKYLNTLLDGLFSHDIEAGAKSFINVEDNNWVVFIETEGHIFIYGQNYSEDQISHFIETIDLSKYKGSEVMGTFELVYRLLKDSNIKDYSLIKDRCFYRLTDYNSEPIGEGIESPTINDLDELVLMFQNYYVEEYDGKRNKSPDFLIPTIKNQIANNSLYIVRDDIAIKAFCSIINPDIGIMFTKDEYRSQGLGRRLMEYCSSLLFEENGISFVMTDMHNVASNKICQKIGYELIYEHTNLKI